MRQPIRNLSAGKQYPTRLFDVVINDEDPTDVCIEQKQGKRIERIPWSDVQTQVNRAIQQSKATAARKLPPSAP